MKKTAKHQKKKLPAKKVSKKKNAPVKKRSITNATKRRISKHTPRVNNMALATVSYNDIVRPDIFEGAKDKSLHLLASYFPDRVLKFITQPTPKKYIMQREGPGKKMFDYVSGWYAKKCANYAFGFNHSFEIKAKEICGTSAIIEGRFIVTDPKTGREIFHKDDIGGHQVRFLKDKAHTAENAVDIANDYKSAATDALKRCMAQIGFFMDVYGVGEAKEDGNYSNGRPEEKPFVQGSNVHVVDIKAAPVQTDYIAKLNKYLDEHPKGPFSVKEKIQFVFQQTKQKVDWVKLNQVQAQVVLATLIRNQK